jgi:GNAT superfamily N-acetyltransferase
MTLRALDPAGDRPRLEALWEAALGGAWPVLPAGLDLLRAGVVAEERGVAVGVAATDPAGSIPLLLVDPAHQRRGVGTGLLAAALQRLAALGVQTVALGSGGEDYIWPGVPDDLPAAVRFFAARGWRWDHAVIDLVRDLRDYRPPAGTYRRARTAGVSLEVAGERELAAVLAFEAATFPTWLRWFERRDSSVLVARDVRGRVVGSLLFRGPDDAFLFAPLLGARAGTIGCVGVADHAQGQGIGSAMVARASELLRREGTRACHIGWTLRQDFYVRVGYAPWRRYLMARRRLTLA